MSHFPCADRGWAPRTPIHIFGLVVLLLATLCQPCRAEPAISREQDTDLGSGYRSLILEPESPYLYYDKQRICSLGQCAVSPSGAYAIFQEGSSDLLFLFRRADGRRLQLSGGAVATVRSFMWHEDVNTVEVHFETGPSESYAVEAAMGEEGLSQTAHVCPSILDVWKIKDLPAAFRRVTLAEPTLPESGRVEYLYFGDQRLGQLGKCSVSPSGYAIFQEEPTGNLLLFHYSDRQVTQLTKQGVSAVDRFEWHEDAGSVEVYFATGLTESYSFKDPVAVQRLALTRHRCAAVEQIEEVVDLGHGFRAFGLLIPGPWEIGHFGFLYYRDQEVCKPGLCSSVSPSGSYVIFQDGPTGNVFLYRRTDGHRAQLTQFTTEVPIVTDFVWHEDAGTVDWHYGTEYRRIEEVMDPEPAEPQDP